MGGSPPFTMMFLMWAVAKVFRIGVLSYGKWPTFAEIVRWARTA